MANSRRIAATTATDTNAMIFLFIFLCLLFGLRCTLSPNDERSHAGPRTSDCNHDAQPALADADGWAVRLGVYLLVPSSKAILLMLLPVGVTMQRSTLPTLSNTDR